MKNTMSVKLSAIPENQAVARGVIQCFASTINTTVDVLSDIKTAVSEAVTNCVVHAYSGGTNYVYIDADIEDNVLSVTIRDEGEGIDDVKKAMQDFYTTKASEERSGLGFTIMSSFMDSINVTSKLGKGTAVTMTKRLA